MRMSGRRFNIKAKKVMLTDSCQPFVRLPKRRSPRRPVNQDTTSLQILTNFGRTHVSNPRNLHVDEAKRDVTKLCLNRDGTES